MVTQFIAAVPNAELKMLVTSLGSESDAVLAAIDFSHDGWRGSLTRSRRCGSVETGTVLSGRWGDVEACRYWPETAERVLMLTGQGVTRISVCTHPGIAGPRSGEQTGQAVHGAIS